MEIVLAVLLLFGGFALGSATAEKNDRTEQSSNSASRIQTTADSVPATQRMRGCLSDKSGMYRDLTVPYINQKDQAAPKGDTCEGECTNE
ncbi:hypothetical protein CODIS_19100 [Candidatus Thiodiazotropha endolucinida]|uniref:Uncharacterized protein n=1 Tax=Candidatus Thiodiazotropha endolucinida TaxID=1655433 RepID=A0A7Z0VLC7_9GAMM|nr:hypothetical protein CODIS_19100 [Candidatus Thiodiazotropha endolucinida]